MGSLGLPAPWQAGLPFLSSLFSFRCFAQRFSSEQSGFWCAWRRRSGFGIFHGDLPHSKFVQVVQFVKKVQ